MQPGQLDEGSEPRADVGTVVEMRVPADTAQLSVMRAAVGAVAIQADFDVDRIADVQMLVDELCSVLVDIAAPDAKLSCSVRLDGSTLGLHAAVTPRPDAELGNPFSWRVLEALTGSLRNWTTTAEGPDGRLAHLEAWNAQGL